MAIEPSEPSSKGTPVRIYRDNANTLLAVEGGVDEDEAEFLGEFGGGEKGAELRAEDGGCDAAAVEAQDAGEG